MVAKAGLGLIGLSAISIGGVALTKPSWLGMGNSMPECHSLALDSDFTSESYTNQFGGKHKHYLVGVTHKGSGTNQTDNKSWWEWSFEKLKKDEINAGKFAVVGTTASDTGNIKVDKEYDGSATNANAKALNQVCKAAYKVGTNKITAAGTNTDEYKEDHVWKYCSFLGEKPKTIADLKEETSTYKTGNMLGKDNEYKSKLVSITGNDKFWEIRDKEFKGGSNGYEKIETGETTDEFFSVGKRKTIQELCGEAYKLEAGTDNSTSTKPKKEKVLKYCSLSKE